MMCSAQCKSRITAFTEPYFSATQQRQTNDLSQFPAITINNNAKLQFSFGENPVSAIDSKIAIEASPVFIYVPRSDRNQWTPTFSQSEIGYDDK